MNHVQLIGRLGRDAERAGSAEDVLAILNLATNERWTDKAGQDVEHTEWHRLVCKGRLAQWALSTLGKEPRCLWRVGCDQHAGPGAMAASDAALKFWWTS